MPTAAERSWRGKAINVTIIADADGTWLPDLKMKRREIADPEARSVPFELDSVDVSNVKTGEDFKAALDKLMEENKDWLLLGMCVELADYTVYIKMVGPVKEVRKQRDAFIKFCLSLKERP